MASRLDEAQCVEFASVEILQHLLRAGPSALRLDGDKADFLMRSVNCVTISVAFRQGFSVSSTRFPLTLPRRTVLIHTLAQSLDHLRTQAECSLRQTQKNILKINQACRSGIR